MFYRTLSPLGPQPCLLDFASPATLAMMAEKSNNSSTWTGPHERLVLEKGAKFQSFSVRPSVRPPPKTGPSLSDAGPGLSETGASHSEVGSVLSEACSGLCKAGSGLSKANSAYLEAGSGLSKAGLGLPEASSGLSDACHGMVAG